MKYINKKTGIIIDVSSPISGANYEPLKETPKKKPARKKKEVVK